MDGSKIKEIRIKLRLTQEKFAVKLGVNPTTVMNWERNKHRPSPLAQKFILSLIQ